MDYDFAILDLADDSDEAVALRRGWIGAVLRGFRDPRPDDEMITRWIDHYRRDEVTVRGAWMPDGEFGAGPMPVATYASLDKTLNAGHELLPLRMITDVTTSSTHRRRGLLRRLIEDDLDDAVAHGVPVAALTASEATIYGRWGFGAATFGQTVELDASPGFALRSFTDPGRVEMLEPVDAWPHVRAVFDTFHRRQHGSVDWPSQYEDIHTGAYDFNDRGTNGKIRAAVHLDADGTVDGFVLFAPGEEKSTKVEEMVGLTPASQLALWTFLAEMDHVRKVTFNIAHPHDPLLWALVDLNRLTFTKTSEFLWIRVLDVERALAARPWAADDTVVLAVDDPQGHASGHYKIETSGARAQVARTDRDADVTLSAETLGALYLGGVTAAALHRAGRLGGSDEAVRRFAAMADLAEPPYCLTGF